VPPSRTRSSGRAAARPISEASTRPFFIDRYLDALGDTDFDDIEHGSVVRTGDFRDHVLRSNGKPAIAVEAKNIGQPLAEEAGKVVKYCSVLGLRWGVVTDGRYLQIYDAPVTGVAPEDRLVLEIDLNDWADPRTSTCVFGPKRRLSQTGDGDGRRTGTFRGA
jgi:predicted type IV restriction endonuclease